MAEKCDEKELKNHFKVEKDYKYKKLSCFDWPKHASGNKSK